MLPLIFASLLAAMPQQDFTWKVILLTGDNQIEAFDNARKSLKNEFLQFGISATNVRELSMSPTETQRGAIPSSAENLQSALLNLSVSKSDGCLIHLTSHGTRQGFAMRNQPVLTPDRLNAILEMGCADRPTVVLVSACYSGTFVGSVMQKPNRIVLTAARDDRTSFGCSPENQFTYWDSCLIDNLTQTDNWHALYGLLQRCIETKESKGSFTPSLPQAYFGDQVKDLKIPGFTATATASVSNNNSNRCPVATDNVYGVTPANAVKVGLDEATGPARESQYLSALRGPAGQPLRSSRIGSVLSGGTVLHIYELSYEGLEKPVPVFLDVYHFESPKAPAGFVCGAEIGF